MRALAAVAILTAVAAGRPLAQTSCDVNGPTPCYSAAGVVSAADYRAGSLTPGAIVSLFGTGLSYCTRGVQRKDLNGNVMPTMLVCPEGAPQVLVGSMPSALFYVSPKQINFQLANNLLPGQTYPLQVDLDANYGPTVYIRLQAAAPAIFQTDATTVVAARPDGSLYTADSPARPYDWVILYATGLGPTAPPVGDLEIPTVAARIVQPNDFQVLLDGAAVDPLLVPYAGVTPGFAGLNQVNLQMPAQFAANPQIQLSLDGVTSPAGITLPAKP